jgi:hypothetical protein
MVTGYFDNSTNLVQAILARPIKIKLFTCSQNQLRNLIEISGCSNECYNLYKGTCLGTPVLIQQIKKPYRYSNNEEYYNSKISYITNLRHPNILLFSKAGVFHDLVHIIYEYPEHGSLSKVLATIDNLTWDNHFLIYIKQICYTMIYLQSKNVDNYNFKLSSKNIFIHRDITKIKLGFRYSSDDEPIYNEKMKIYEFGLVISDLIDYTKSHDDIIPDIIFEIYNLCTQDDLDYRPTFKEIQYMLHE